MQRIRLEILIEDVQADERLWVLELIVDESEVFRLYRYYGKATDANFIKRLQYTSEDFETAVQEFEKVFKNKLLKKEYRRFRNGEQVRSLGLFNILKPSNNTDQEKKSITKSENQSEHRKIRI